MAVTAQRVPSFDELYEAIRALPEGITGEILSDGRIETMGRPGRGHRRAFSQLFHGLAGLGERVSGRWVVEPEAEIRLLTDRLAVPDLAGWRVSGDDEDFLDENPITRLPDWTCEVLSSTTERKDRGDKLRLYARAGVGHTWLVDPDARFIEVYTPQDGLPTQITVAREADRAILPPFDLEIDLTTLWVPRRG